MKKYILILLIATLFNSLQKVAASPVTQDDARAIAIAWYTHVTRSFVNDHPIRNSFSIFHDEQVTMYVFNFTSGGFVIVAADDASVPILGYSEENSFPADMSCPAVKQWMENYSAQIEQIKKGGLSNRETLPQWDAIMNGNFLESTRNVGPLLTTTWYQDGFYSELCPADPAGPYGHAVTGCIATALAQIMKYHSHPPQGVGSHSYTHPKYGAQSADFGNTLYDWDSMPDRPTSSNLALATIMYHAGVSVNMDYGPDESGSSDIWIKKALVDYFNYQPIAEWHHRRDFPDTEDWNALIRSNLDNLSPIYYCGSKPDDGHAFVCDGYRLSENTFHMNWGWNGLYDGWYVMGQLNNAYGNWNLDNRIITGIRPYNPDLVTRITQPEDNFVALAGSVIVIEAATVRGNADKMKITIDGVPVAAGTSNNLSYSWETKDGDLGSHDVRSWSFSENDSVYYPINLNVSEWVTQTSGFPTTLRRIMSISAVDSTVAWASAWDGIGGWEVPCQDFTRTTDGGQTWVAGTIQNHEDLTIAMIEGWSAQKAYAAMYRRSPGILQGIFVTTDGGTTWERQETASFTHAGSAPCFVHFFNEKDGLCVGDPVTMGGRFEMYTTTDGGTNWIPVAAANIPGSIPGEMGNQEFSAINDTVWFGTNFGRIFKSTDKGYTWTAVSVNGMAGEFVVPVFRNGSHGLVFNWWNRGSEPLLCETFDGGHTWEMVEYTGPLYQTDLAYVPGTANTWVSAGGTHDPTDIGASYSSDGGHTWTVFPGMDGISLFQTDWVSSCCGWAGGQNIRASEGGILKFTGDLSVPYAIDDPETGKIPFSVYPNPFSSNTAIVFSVPETGMVNLSVYDISGRLVERILSGKMARGEHRIEWDAGSLGAGIYFMRFELDAITQVSKIIILNNP